MKRGSALLVVLGLLSFLIISAVAFSMYMRTERLPSSYLLRSASSRQLARAALARVMSQIDEAIGNNPHPGVGGNEGNVWRGRVFFNDSTVATIDDTVSTMTLEALAYLPAPLINTTRYYSRLTPTASWQYMDMDVGRFAYTAVDVSDYFDVHRTQAAPLYGSASKGGGRTSADNGRVTLAYLFEDPTHKSKDNWRVVPDKWDTFMEKFTDPNAVPLVSWADFNLALWDTGNNAPAGVISPWCRFVEGGTEFLQDATADYQMLSNEVFVTDSLYARTSELDISVNANQPFAGLDISDKAACRNRSAEDVLMMNMNPFLSKFADQIQQPELVQLYDYLDVDSVPATLAMPTTERVPMVIGVSLNAGSDLHFELKTEKRTIDKPGKPKKKYEVTKHMLTLKGDLRPLIAAVYPFKYNRGSDDTDTFQAQIAASLTLVPKDSQEFLRRPAAASPAVCPWDTGILAPQAQAYAGAGDYKSVMIMRTAMVPLTLNRSPTKEEDCLIVPPDAAFEGIEFPLTARMDKSAYDSGDANDVCTLRTVQELDPETDGPIGGILEVTKGFLPSNAELSGPVAQEPSAIADGAEFVPVIQLWVRVVNKDGDTVDLMPACVADDRMPAATLRDSQEKVSRSTRERPLLRFSDKDSTVSLSASWFANFQDKPVTIAPHAYVADDPRFNHAPEDLVAVENLTGEVQDYWLANNTRQKGDGDIFMTTSDAGYLQSKFELAHILNISGLWTHNKGDQYWGVLGSTDYNGQKRTKFGEAPSKDAQWRTFASFKTAAIGTVDDIGKLEIRNGSRGTRICPYTPSRTVMMGALANTPRDWWTASTNDTTNVKKGMLGSIANALPYTFSEYSSDGRCKVSWAALENLSDVLRARHRDSADVGGWEMVFDNKIVDPQKESKNIPWNTLFDAIEDKSEDTVALDSVDRKFLHGFWRECFEARQQLFLVFLRAEPLLMGSGSLTRIPPVLGARAVALVWRNPIAPSDTSAPHTMRVLFYRNLD